MKIPKRKSDDFMSFAGHMDRRVKLDEKIEPGNARYNSALAVMAAKLAYENKGFIRNTVEQHWKVIFLPFLIMDLFGLSLDIIDVSHFEESTYGADGIH